MTQMDELPFEELREFAAGLAGLRAEPPPSLRPRVLERVGLADAYVTLDSQAGPIFVAFNGRGVSATWPYGDPGGFEEGFRARFARPIRPADHPPEALARQLDRWLGAGRRGRPPRVDLRRSTPFEQDVLAKALEIPRGELRPYAWVAREIGRPAAVRAVGQALGRNPVPVVIPCHRVVRSDGRIDGYAWGTPRKRALLVAEGVDLDSVARLAGKGVRYLGSDTTGVFCLPTCRSARRITPAHRVGFRSAAEAAAAGYRACKDCRPAPQPAAG